MVWRMRPKEKKVGTGTQPETPRPENGCDESVKAFDDNVAQRHMQELQAQLLNANASLQAKLTHELERFNKLDLSGIVDEVWAESTENGWFLCWKGGEVPVRFIEQVMVTNPGDPDGKPWVKPAKITMWRHQPPTLTEGRIYFPTRGEITLVMHSGQNRVIGNIDARRLDLVYDLVRTIWKAL
jgi:hypothetical protein